MDSKRVIQLVNKIRTAIDNAAMISQKVWAYKRGDNEVSYQLSWFDKIDECHVEYFKSFKELTTFANELIKNKD